MPQLTPAGSFSFLFLADFLDRSCFQTSGKKTLCLTSVFVLQRSTTAAGEQPKNCYFSLGGFCFVFFLFFPSHLLIKPFAHSVPAINPSAGTWRGGDQEEGEQCVLSLSCTTASTVPSRRWSCHQPQQHSPHHLLPFLQGLLLFWELLPPCLKIFIARVSFDIIKKICCGRSCPQHLVLQQVFSF